MRKSITGVFGYGFEFGFLLRDFNSMTKKKNMKTKPIKAVGGWAVIRNGKFKVSDVRTFEHHALTRERYLKEKGFKNLEIIPVLITPIKPLKKR